MNAPAGEQPNNFCQHAGWDTLGLLEPPQSRDSCDRRSWCWIEPMPRRASDGAAAAMTDIEIIFKSAGLGAFMGQGKEG